MPTFADNPIAVLGSFRCRAICAAAVVGLAPLAGAMQDDDAPRRGPILVRDDLTSQPINLVQLGDEELVHRDEADDFETVDLDRCIAIIRPAAQPRAFGQGVLELADGQRLPGQAISNARPDEDVLAWNHEWLGRLAVPLELVRSLRVSPFAPSVTPGDADLVLLSNGDRLEGFIVALGDPIELEVTGADGPQVVQIPLDRVVSVAMVTPVQPSSSRRVWFDDGTVIDVSSLSIGDDGFVRLSSSWVGSGMLEHRLRFDEIAAILFAPGAMRPLATVAPSRLSGPETRYVVPEPRELDVDPPLDLARLEYRGPLVVRYALPRGTKRFAAEALLPTGSRAWGDYELAVYDDDREVFRAHLDRTSPTASINVRLEGSELTIELTEGRFGPIQDRLVLERAMLR